MITLTKLGWTLLMLNPGEPGWLAPAQAELLLRMLAEVETGTTAIGVPCGKVGRAGERSAWQITRATWCDYTTTPFDQASTDAAAARLVAELHLRNLARAAIRQGLQVTPYLLALGWNGGTGKWTSKNFDDDFAQRAAATMQRIEEEQQVLTIRPCGTAGKVWVQSSTGDGGQFPAAEVAAVMTDEAMLRGYFRANH